MSNLLQACGISKQYKQEKVVDNLSLDLRQGEVVGMLGPNGAGKTTAFYMIAGLIKPDSGRIRMNDEDISHWPLHKRAEAGVGYLPQETSIFRRLSVEDNIRVALEASHKEDDIDNRLEQVIDDMQLSAIRDRLGLSLSGGERRRTEIGRLIATQPTFLLLDEPFAGVDPISISELQKLISNFKQQNFGLLISDQNVQATLHICDRAYVIHRGEVLVQGTPDEIMQNDVVRDVYLGSEFQI